MYLVLRKVAGKSVKMELYETQKVLFVNIAVSFTSLIPCLILPTDDRENSERTTTELPVTKKRVFLRLN